MYQVITIPAFTDNYFWALVSKQNQCVIVDPGDAEPVLNFLTKNKLELTDILITHHHPDHIGGVQQLIDTFPTVNIHGPNTRRFPMVNHPCKEADEIHLESLSTTFKVMELPGHTLDHIGYYDGNNIFLGDTLFSAGCGRLFEGTPEQMYGTLTRVAALKPNTNIYCAHEYTQTNLKFAQTVDTHNNALCDYQNVVNKLRNNKKPTIPTLLSTELSINPFLRVHKKEIKRSVQAHFSMTETLSNKQCFALLREWKDNF